jgi:hypothetical protein
MGLTLSKSQRTFLSIIYQKNQILGGLSKGTVILDQLNFYQLPFQIGLMFFVQFLVPKFLSNRTYIFLVLGIQILFFGVLGLWNFWAKEIDNLVVWDRFGVAFFFLIIINTQIFNP